MINFALITVILMAVIYDSILIITLMAHNKRIKVKAKRRMAK